MAIVTSLERDDRSGGAPHPTHLVAKYVVFGPKGARVLQINSYGSGERQIPDKLSQTLQFNEISARQLFLALKAEFGFEE